MITLNILSITDRIKLQWYGMGVAYQEHVKLLKRKLPKDYKIFVNSKRHADIVHFHTATPNYYFQIPFIRRKSILIGHVHSLPETFRGSIEMPFLIRKVFDWYLISFFKKMDHVVAVSPMFVNVLRDYGFQKNKIVYIPYTASRDEFYPLPLDEKMRIRSKYGLGKNDFVVLGVGQLQTRKGVLDFIEVAKRLKNLKFIWVGDFAFGRSTSGYTKIKEEIDRAPLNVEFWGAKERKELNEIYNIADVFFFPSYNETFGIVILEALNTNLPVLLRDIDVYKYIFNNYYAKGNSNAEFINELKHLYEDRSYYIEYKQKSIEGSNLYNEDEIVKMWDSFYRSVVNLKR